MELTELKDKLKNCKDWDELEPLIVEGLEKLHDSLPEEDKKALENQTFEEFIDEIFSGYDEIDVEDEMDAEKE